MGEMGGGEIGGQSCALPHAHTSGPLHTHTNTHTHTHTHAYRIPEQEVTNLSKELRARGLGEVAAAMEEEAHQEALRRALPPGAINIINVKDDR